MEIREQAARLRRALEAAVSPRGRRLFPEPLMREAVSYFAARAAEGASTEAVGAELGLAANTLRRWQQRLGPAARVAARTAPPVVPVTVLAPGAPPPSSARPVLVRTAEGLRIEGLDLDAIAELLRRLA